MLDSQIWHNTTVKISGFGTGVCRTKSERNTCKVLTDTTQVQLVIKKLTVTPIITGNAQAPQKQDLWRLGVEQPVLEHLSHQTMEHFNGSLGALKKKKEMKILMDVTCCEVVRITSPVQLW